MLLTDNLFMHGQRCQRRAFLEVYGDHQQKQGESDYLSKIIQDSGSYRKQVLRRYNAIRPMPDLVGEADEYSRQVAIVQATETLMQEGVEAIAHGYLTRRDPSGLTYLSSPDLLLKCPGLSRFGDWCYIPVTIKLGRRIKLDYQLLALFHAFVLADFQSLWPPQTGLILRESPKHSPQQQPYWVSFRERLPSFQDSLQAFQRILLDRLEPEVFIARNRCSLCLWLNHCSEVAQASQHLSLLPGVTPKRYEVLKKLGIQTLETLVNTPPHTLEPLTGFGPIVTRELLQQAQSTLHQTPLLHTPPDYLLPLMDPVEFYFDIESQPDLNLIYLHGVLMVQGEHEQFYPFLAESPEAEQQAWTAFLELVMTYPQALIYHFCPYEVECIRRLGKQFHTPHSTIDRLVRRCVDLHAWVTQTVTLPVESYALKSIARWLGFQWRQEEVNGAQAICWYNQWIQTGDRTFLDQILIYNEDDCRATYQLKTWLAQFLQESYSDRSKLNPIPSLLSVNSLKTDSVPASAERSA
ncbi:MAG: TM0106 family RecB-like putative nuclease [Prochlorotrichaceae cyanobacterium]|jgi:uncharacterized protein